MTENAKKKVAVYGSLRKDMGNWQWFLKEAKYEGEFDSEPIFTMYSINDAYPGLIEKGNTSVVMEVYSVTDEELKEIDQLEGYVPNSKNNHYNRIEIDTPYGVAYTYIYNSNLSGYEKVNSGDWKDFMNNKKLLSILT